jgi:type VI secretion system secreted protein VgrG
MTSTSPADDNAFNEIRFEDAEDAEFIYIQAQRDLQKLVKRNETERTGQNRAILVGGSRTAIVGAVHTTLVGAKYSVQAMEKPLPEDLKILKLEKPTVKPLPTKLEMIEGRILCTSGKATAIVNKSSIVFEAKGNITFRAKGGKIIVQGGPKIKINS